MLPLKTGPYLIIDKPTETTYILKDNKKEQLTVQKSHCTLLSQRKTYKIRTTKLSPCRKTTLKQPKINTKRESEVRHQEQEQTHQYNLRKRKITLI